MTSSGRPVIGDILAKTPKDKYIPSGFRPAGEVMK
jgi:hypothetical protein